MTLLTAVERALRRSGMPPSKFGRLAARDPRLVFDLRNGRQPGAAVSDRVNTFISSFEPTTCTGGRRHETAASRR